VKIHPPNYITDQIYDYLMERIQSGVFDFGDRLVETQVAESLNISRTPVREAFRRLEQDGIVERLPQGGLRVTPIDSDTIHEISRIRSLLEAYAVELACDRISENDIERLEQIMKEASSFIDSKIKTREDKIRQLFKLNTLFHDIIDQASGSRYLAKLINNMRLMVLRLRAMGIRKDNVWREVWKEHSELIGMLKRRDKTAASNLIRSHIEKAASLAIACKQWNEE